MVYGIQSPFTGEFHYPPAGKCWRPEQREVLQWLRGRGVAYEQRDLNDTERRAMVVGVQADQVPAVKGLVVKGSLAEAREAATRVRKHEAWPRMFFRVDGQGRPQLKNHLENVK